MTQAPAKSAFEGIPDVPPADRDFFS